jgi:DNA mismatch endonuclease (patch repair protein)
LTRKNVFPCNGLKIKDKALFSVNFFVYNEESGPDGTSWMADVFSREKRSWLMARVRSGNTSPERLVRSLLHRLGLRFRLKNKELPGTPDIVLPRFQAVVFVHGCFWHGHTRCSKGRTMPSTNRDFWRDKIAKNRARDRRAVRALHRLGWSVFTLWECELRSERTSAQRITALVKELGG